MSSTIAITANGKRHEIAARLSLDDFLKSAGLAPQLVVVERNREALTPAEARRAVLADGDVLEIVRIVAGG